MKIFDKILWAVDLQQNYELSVAKLIQISKQFGNDIIILKVLPDDLKKSSYNNLVNKSVQKEISELADSFSSEKGLKVSTKVVYGSLIDSTIALAEKENVNAIYLNQTKSDNDKYGKLGKNAFNIVLNSTKPVVIMSNDPISEKSEIVCPVDFSDASGMALKDAILHAKKAGNKLNVISVFTPINITSPRVVYLGVDVNEENEKLYSNYKTDFDTFLKGFDFLDIEYETICLKGDPAVEIVNFAKNHDILYMGSTGKSGLKRVIMGSVTEQVIQDVPCNMVITKSVDVFKIKAPTNITDINNHFELGKQLSELGQYNDAIKHFKECLNINSMHIPSVVELANIFTKLGEDDRVKYYDELYKSIMAQFNNWKIEEEIRKNIGL